MQQAMGALRQSKDFQTATQLVTLRLEQARAMEFDDLAAGAQSSFVAAQASAGTETKIQGGGPYTFEGEALRTHGQSSGQVASPLNPYLTQTVVDGIAFTVATYVTECWQPVDSPGTCNAVRSGDTDDQLLRITTVADWTPPGSETSRSLRNQSLAYSPDSCLSPSTHPFSAPCQAFFYSSGSVGGGSIAVIGAAGGEELAPIFATGAARAATLQLPTADSTLQLEQVGRAKASATGSILTIDEEVTGGEAATAQATDDPAQVQPSAEANLSAASVSGVVDSQGGLTLTMAGSAASGRVVASGASTSANDCRTAANVPQVNSRACAAATVSAADTSEAALSGTIGTVDMSTTLAEVEPAQFADPASRTHVGNFLQGSNNLCLAAATPGCTASDLRDATGTVVLGGLPAGMTAPTGWEGGAIILGPGEVIMSAEQGQGAATTTAPQVIAPMQLRIWNGSGYTVEDLSDDTAGYEASPVDIERSSGDVSVRLVASTPEGEESQQAGIADWGPTGFLTSTDCDPCASTATVDGFSANVRYEIAVDGAPIADFTVRVDVRELRASANYMPAPEGDS